MAMRIEKSEVVNAPDAYYITLDNGDLFLIEQTGDGQRLEISGLKGKGSFFVAPRLANVIEVGRKL